MQGLNVGPTPKPLFSCLFKSTLFNRNDLPVLYLPTKLIIPMLVKDFWLSNFFASSGMMNLPLSKITNGSAFGVVELSSFSILLFNDISLSSS